MASEIKCIKMHIMLTNCDIIITELVKIIMKLGRHLSKTD